MSIPGMRRRRKQVHSPGGAALSWSGMLWSQRNHEGDTAQLMERGTSSTQPKAGVSPSSCPLLHILVLPSWSLTWAPAALGMALHSSWCSRRDLGANLEGNGISAFLLSMHCCHSVSGAAHPGSIRTSLLQFPGNICTKTRAALD